jgi:Uma2 family endonuclease
MAEAGILGESERVGLIEGELIELPPFNPPHAGTVALLTELLVHAVGGQATVWSQSSVRLSDLSLPQPDFAVLKRRADYYASRIPTPEDFLLAIEVSDTTLRFDRGPKAVLYARHRIPELWVVDLTHHRLVRFRQPSAKGYRRVDQLHGLVAPKLLPECPMDVARIFATVR